MRMKVFNDLFNGLESTARTKKGRQISVGELAKLLAFDVGIMVERQTLSDYTKGDYKSMRIDVLIALIVLKMEKEDATADDIIKILTSVLTKDQIKAIKSIAKKMA